MVMEMVLISFVQVGKTDVKWKFLRLNLKPFSGTKQRMKDFSDHRVSGTKRTHLCFVTIPAQLTWFHTGLKRDIMILLPRVGESLEVCPRTLLFLMSSESFI
ncbi:hypothetical protein NPIL_704231 [Nephila pilipes]|uniref:Uncharacterized protein n=1 Tax=Nephila pilipes TaxID=299642 RepID=A0A8X6P382_NEPPI|nr:hypothetical protein NPIL_704231 [Nephila pilipes]